MELALIAALAALHGEPGAADDLTWLQHVLIDVSPGTPTDAARLVAAQVPADTVEWYQGIQANRDDLMRSRGIATSGAEQYEFEESLQFTSAEVWQHFAVDGAAMNESGLPPSGGFGGKETMTDIAPLWAEQVRQGLLRPALFGDCVTQDNVGAPMYSAANGGFDVRTNALFLAGPGGRLGLGANFSMGEYTTALRKRLGAANAFPCAPFKPCPGGVSLVQDGVVREIIRFHFLQHLAAWRATFLAIKQAAAESGRPEPAVYGNVHIVENAYSVVVSQYLDVVWTETPAFFPHVGKPTWGGAASGFSALQYKLGRAAGNFSKPHWGIDTLTGCGLAPTTGPRQLMTAILGAAEAVANGGVAALLLGDSLGGATADPCLASSQRWAAFADMHRHLLSRDRRKQADIAILYSVPSRFWLEDTSMSVGYPWAYTNTSALPLSDVFSGVARVAEDHHLLYDVLIQDHPDLSSFGHLRTRLASFRVLVLPLVQAISDEDAELLAAWVRRGGTLVAVDWEQTAMYDEDFVSRPAKGVTAGGCRSATLQRLLADPGQGYVRILTKELQRYCYQGYHGKLDDAAIAAAMVPPRTPTWPPILSTDGLPKTVWANVWVHGAGHGPMRSVQLVNYDGNATANSLSPVTSAFTLQLRCDERNVVPGGRTSRSRSSGGAAAGLGCNDIVNATLTVTTPACDGAELASEAPRPLALTKSTASGVPVLSVTVPAGAITAELGVVSFFARGEVRLRAAAAKARKRTEQLRIAQRSQRLRSSNSPRSYEYAAVVASADAAVRAVEERALTPGLLAGGEAKLLALASTLEAEVANITRFVQAASVASRAATLAAAGSSSLAIAAAAASNSPQPSAGAAWKPLRIDSAFDASIGYGWVDGNRSSRAGRQLVASVEAALALAHDSVHANFIGGGSTTSSATDRRPSTLRLELPPAMQAGGVVTVVTGAYDTGRLAVSTAVRVEGAAKLAIPGDLDRSGFFRHVAFRVDPVKPAGGNRSLFLTFSSASLGHFYGDSYGQGLHVQSWLINAVLLSVGSVPPTAEGRRYLALAEGLAATALERWAFIGPFSDPHFTARNLTLGPEAGRTVNTSASYPDGFGGTASWQAGPAVVHSTGAPAAVRMSLHAASQSANRSVAVLFCASIFVPPSSSAKGSSATLEAQLTGSTSSLASLRINGGALAPDRLINGRSLSEFTRAVTLGLHPNVTSQYSSTTLYQFSDYVQSLLFESDNRIYP
jgi:hypothetical protein